MWKTLFSAFSARHRITSQRNMFLPETVDALSIVVEEYKNERQQWIVNNLTFRSCVCFVFHELAS